MLGGDVSDLRDGWKTQLASDIDRDGMGLELLDPRFKPLSEQAWKNG